MKHTPPEQAASMAEDGTHYGVTAVAQSGTPAQTLTATSTATHSNRR